MDRKLELQPARGRDLESPPWCYLLWGVPGVVAFAAVASYQASLISLTVEGSLWTVSVAWAGVGCFINGRTCGRVHCVIDGILFPILAVVGLLNVLSVVSFSWSLFWLAFLVILTVSFLPEVLWRKYSGQR